MIYSVSQHIGIPIGDVAVQVKANAVSISQHGELAKALTGFPENVSTWLIYKITPWKRNSAGEIVYDEGEQRPYSSPKQHPVLDGDVTKLVWLELGDISTLEQVQGKIGEISDAVGGFNGVFNTDGVREWVSISYSLK